MLVDLVEDHGGHFAPAEFHHDPHPVPVGFVPDIRDAVDFLIPDQFRDLLDQPRLVHLVRQFRDDDRLFFGLGMNLDRGLPPQGQNAPSGFIGVLDSLHPADKSAGRKIRALDDAHQFLDRDLRTVDHQGQGVDHLGQVMRRDVRRHTDRDSG